MSLKPDCELRPSRNASVSVASDARCGRSARVWRACPRDGPNHDRSSSIAALSRGTIGALAYVAVRQPERLLATTTERAEQAGSCGRHRGRVAIRRGTSSLATAWLLLSEVSSPGGAVEAAALVLAVQEFVASGGGWPSGRRRESAASPGRRVSSGRVGGRGCWRSGGAASARPVYVLETAPISPKRKRARAPDGGFHQKLIAYGDRWKDHHYHVGQRNIRGVHERL